MCRVFCLYVCACVSSAQRGQKRALLPLELEVQVVLSRCMLLGIESGFTGRAASALNCYSISSAPLHVLRRHILVSQAWNTRDMRTL